MPYDLVIKNGTVIDGSGLPGFRADVGVRHGRIVSIGRIRERGRETLDAEGHVVAPGFVDGHTHMDAQVFWDPMGTSSCYHGITTVVMGNCGFTLAPCAAKDKHFVVRNLQRAEDIPPEAMEAELDWGSTTFPEVPDTLESPRKGINYAGYIGHSELRTYVLGERAFGRMYMALLDETAAEGGRMFAQAHSRWLSALLSFKTQMPFDRLPLWKDLRKLPLAEKIAKLRDPEFKKKLVEATNETPDKKALGTEARPQPYEWLFVFDTVEGPHRSVAEVAAERGVHPAQAMIDLALEKDLDLFFLMPVANEDQDDALEIMKHPRACVTFSDSGAHVTQLMDSSLQTHLLAHWVRKKQAFTLPQAVRMLTLVPATLWGFADRGLVREGMAADFVVFDPESIGAEMPELVADLPAGAKRLVQRCPGGAALREGARGGRHAGRPVAADGVQDRVPERSEVRAGIQEVAPGRGCRPPRC